MLSIQFTSVLLPRILFELLLWRAENFVETARVSNYPTSDEVTTNNIKTTIYPREAEPDFMGPIENTTGAVGREAVLTCSIANLADYKVAWIRADDQTILSLQTKLVTHSPRYAVTNDPSVSWRLHIRPLKVTDRGCYMCQINTSTMKKQVGCIDVLVPPNILDEGTSSDMTIQEGMDVNIMCKADGRPEPRILWRREDGANLLVRNEVGVLNRVDNIIGPLLKLTKVDRKQMGAYLCIASNDVPPSVSKRIMLTVNFTPSIKIKTKILKVTTGSQATLECVTEANPKANTYWVKSGEEMIISGEKYDIFEERLSSYQMRSTLIIMKFSANDVGSYTCYSSNAFGKTEGTIRLYEIKTTTTTTSTTTTTTSTTTTEVQTTTLPTTEAKDTSVSQLMVPIQPAEHKYFKPSPTYGTMKNFIDHSVLENSWLSTAESANSGAHRTSSDHIYGVIFKYLLVFTCIIVSNDTIIKNLFEKTR